MSVKTVYDQIRIIDINGNELVRVNYNNGSPAIVSDGDLQDKSGRYYFENSIILLENDLYVSKLDLNIEGGEIEVIDGETKPMLRLATPLYNDDNEKIGVLVVNYLAKDLLDSSSRLVLNEQSHFEVLNNDGYYLKSTNEEYEFSFMYDESQHIKYNDNHEIDILQSSSGVLKQVSFNNEFYTYISITEESLSDSITKLLGSNVSVVNESERFIIVGEIELSDLDNYRSIRNWTIVITIIFVYISLIITRLIDGVTYYRNQQIITLEYTANHDALTKLPNRNKLFADTNYKLSRNKPIAILYMDFDGFKKINDEYGHDIGDLALVKGVQRIQNVIRQDDLLARVGGDEFVAVLFDIDTNENVEKVISKITEKFTSSFDLSGNICNMGISIGYSISKEGDTLDDLLKVADSRMYFAKEDKRKE
jgi:diguanylate cyclase (GGDEF)-like protein